MNRDSSVLVTCRELVVGHGGRAILSPVNLSIRSGELWVVAGGNGSGKTTWVRTLLGLLPPVSGSVVFARAIDLCYSSQRQSFDRHYPLVAKDVVAMGTQRKGALFPGSAGARRVREALELTSATELADVGFHELSEGQKQRVLLARVHAARAELAVLDEPTSAMDGGAERDAWELLERVRRASGLAVVVVTHAHALAAEYAEHVLAFERETRRVRAGSAELLRTGAAHAVSSEPAGAP